MAETTLLITFLGMALVTYLPRLLPAWLLRGRQLPPFLSAWLRYIPAAVLAALLIPSLLVENRELNLAWKKKSLFGTVLIGMLVVALARLVFGLE